ncbi:hypothetical protein FJ420_01845 [Mesorhizobium sp. B3-1-3]|uniref:hypothetical protein n=1 Tax=unclassified Mesorhizobium TaxID=325217 RepID=UPI00112ED286|nr:MULTISPECIES: hypothetical protein [unclassified Mesorhizobium]TPI67580.1 hypothetical protein FJ424_09815 [Mesorhizobium sp. B3-1-8]TPI75626.1 hypothetical protein FJ420_01845 [Mesorhizobium sp. B3-1-3]
MSIYSKNDYARCIDATGTSLTVGKLYRVQSFHSGGSYNRILIDNDKGWSAKYNVRRFEKVEAKTGKAKPATPFGQVKAVTVNKSDVHHMLTFYVQSVLGIRATVEKIVDKFPEAVELVLKQEAA